MRFYILFGLVLTILLSSSVFGVSVAPIKTEINFHPGEIHNLTFYVFNNMRSTQSFQPALKDSYFSDYMTIYPDIVKDLAPGERRPFYINIKLPDDVEVPGEHKTYVGAYEAIPKNLNGIGARAAIFVPINIMVPFPGKYLNLEIAVHHIKVGETLDITITGLNQGKELVQLAGARIDIYDSNNNIVGSTSTNQISIPVEQERKLTAEWNSDGIKPGPYKAVAIVNYDGIEKELTQNFFIGDIVMEILNNTKQLYVGEINQFDVEVQSKWNFPINNVYAVVQFYDEDDKKIGTIKSPNVKFDVWETGRLSAYWNLQDYEKTGPVTAEMRVHYAGDYAKKLSVVNLADKRDGDKIDLLDEERPITIISWSAVTIILIIILIIANMVWFMSRVKNGKRR